MTIRTVRLDESTDKILDDIVKTTGLSMSAVIKKGLTSLYEKLTKEQEVTPYDIYSSLSIGKGRRNIPPSTSSKAAVQKAILLKYKKRGCR